MAKKTKAEQAPDVDETPAVVATVPASSAAPGSAAAWPTRDRAASEPKRLSKGQRKHVRRLKQAGEYKPIRPR